MPLLTAPRRIAAAVLAALALPAALVACGPGPIETAAVDRAFAAVDRALKAEERALEAEERALEARAAEDRAAVDRALEAALAEGDTEAAEAAIAALAIAAYFELPGPSHAVKATMAARKAERAALVAENTTRFGDTLEAEHYAREAERAALEAEHYAREAERAALEAERAAPEAAAPGP